ncbi:DUF1492 domain-containing protein [Anaerosacchariphilus polymeriproducens]|uniref:DUF1492 domain-containing protein n=1 Tax=Anaerosacchariphilus polymeriproducens TaxID=1812858 RepID=A0A371ARM7_9FIRM|nr:DUF1492 domain-containing protein [Anaerosacchariphilus polymeriproducens]RDU22194.1 DUF1492 domain-containing protein [Anaerosacchariphilus polymeriproducens]
MNVREYLNQSYWLDKRIKANLEEVENLRQIAYGISSPIFDIDRVQTTRSNEVHFVKCINKIMDLEQKINEEITMLLELKEQIREVISGVESIDEQMVLMYRYKKNYTWEMIARELHAGRTTIHRWHDHAIESIVLPEDMIQI